MMSESIGAQFAKLTLVQIKNFKRKLRTSGRTNPLSLGLANETVKPLVMAQRKLTVQRGYLAIEYFLDFRKLLKKAR
jgi:hypothetical protein